MSYSSFLFSSVATKQGVKPCVSGLGISFEFRLIMCFTWTQAVCSSATRRTNGLYLANLSAIWHDSCWTYCVIFFGRGESGKGLPDSKNTLLQTLYTFLLWGKEWDPYPHQHKDKMFCRGGDFFALPMLATQCLEAWYGSGLAPDPHWLVYKQKQKGTVSIGGSYPAAKQYCYLGFLTYRSWCRYVV